MSAITYQRPIRVGPWWRVWPDVVAHWLSERRLFNRRLFPSRLQGAACAWRGDHAYRYLIG